MRIFVDPARLVAGAVVIRDDEHHYLGRVRRSRVGDAVEVVDGAGRRARGVIERIAEHETIVRLGEPEPVPAAAPRVRVVVPLIKGDRMDGCIEKLVEVGADAVIVWPAERAVVRLHRDRLAARLQHFRDIAQAAARQSGRAAIPMVDFEPTLVGAIPPGDTGIVLDPGADEPLTAPTADAVTLVTGPEGGLSLAERDWLATHGFAACSLGPRVLRADTAPVIAVALVRALTRS